jgi:flagellar hook-associated protein 3 FlgL
MIRSTQQTFYRLDNLNAEQERLNYQLSTGKKIQYGSEDANTYTREVYVEDKIRVYEGIKSQLEKTNAQNDGSDTTLASAKDLVTYVKAEIIKALNATTDDTGKEAIASNLEGVKENLLTFGNEAIEGEYIFSGSDSSIKPFEIADNGKVTYVGDNELRKVVVEDGSYRERGVNGFESFFYPTDTALKGETLTFSIEDRIIDQDGSEWKLDASTTVASTGTLNFSTDDAIVDQDGTVWTLNDANTELKDGKGNTLLVTDLGSGNYSVVVPNSTGNETLGIADQVVQYDTSGDATGEVLNIAGSGPDSFTLVVPSDDGTKFEAKSSIFDLLDDMINALNKVDESGNAISDDIAQSELRTTLDEVTKAYDGMNSGHAKLGVRNNIFEVSYERVTAKVFQYEKLQIDISGVDLAEVATEAKALELTYSALYSTINRMNELSLVNFLR